MREVISGIYKITNLENGKIYIGKSEDIKTRWNCHEIIHKMKLLKELQSANNVSFELLEKVPLERLNAAEEYYIKSFKSGFVEEIPKGGMIMWVARDKDGQLGLYDGKPHRTLDFWSYDGNLTVIDKKQDWLLGKIILKDLKWEDEPIEIELVKKGEA